MPKRAEHGFWAHDGLFWDTGCTCNLLQGHTCARRGPSGATLPDCMQRSVQAGWPQASTTPAPLRRAATARMATSPASRLVAATRWPLEAAQASAQPKESKARRPGQHISPGIDHCQSVLLPKKAPTATGPPARRVSLGLGSGACTRANRLRRLEARCATWGRRR